MTHLADKPCLAVGGESLLNRPGISVNRRSAASIAASGPGQHIALRKRAGLYGVWQTGSCSK